MAAEIEHRDLTEDEARAFVRHVRASVEEIGAWIVRAVTGRAWVALGYPSWDAMCEAEFDGAVIRLPREDRREAVASLREAGLSTRAIAGALGVNHSTVVRDHKSSGADAPVEKVTSLDGRSRPATQQARPSVEEEAERLVEAYPELDHYAEQGRTEDVVRLGRALDAYSEPERSIRRENLTKSIAAQIRRAQNPEPERSEPDWAALVDEMFAAATTALTRIRMAGGADTVARVIDGADPLTVSNWHDQFADLAHHCQELTAACKPKLRRIK